MTGLVEGFLKKTEEKKLYFTAAQIRKEGQVIDEWTRFLGKPRFEAYSISKTFAAAGVGIAIKEGLITLDDRIVDSFPEESYDLTNENALKITVRDLLTMTGAIISRTDRKSFYRSF
jgi:CubicO group peptidase (beta-lactamase class C family)